MSSSPMIVVGTTPDYVVRISRKCHPGSALFVLDSRHLNNHLLSDINRSILIFVDLERYDETLISLKKRLSQGRVSNPGFACFDCESLIMASRLAGHFKSPFPSTEAILLTRSKFLSREIWRKAGLDNPEAGLASDVDETLRYFHRFKRDIVLKPISGSGSELVFRCLDEVGVRESVAIMEEQLKKRRCNPLFRPIKDPFTSMTMDPCEKWVVEEYVPGPEFSSDFMLREDKVTILRETGKIKADDQTFGSVMAYTIPPVYPEGFSREDLYRVFLLAAKSLGYEWGHFMVDFIIRENSVVIIELAPRPGGDSIPDLLEAATGRDLLEEHLKIMAGQFDASVTAPAPSLPHASINLFMPESGLITHLDASEIIAQPQVKSVLLKKKIGDRVTLPPDDYDNRLVGNCIVRWDYGWDPISTCRHFQELLKISVDNGHSGYQDSDRMR
jgi:biotin carboxylase